MSKKVFTVALTGGIGCGKSFVSDIFARCGAEVFSADETAGELRKRTDVAETVCEILGRDVSVAGGGLDAAKVADVIFNDEEARKKLEEYMHPLIRREISSAILQMSEKSEGRRIAVVEVPLLFECGWMDDFDKTAAVWSAKEAVMQRIRNRNWDEKEYKRRAALQLSADEKLAKADYGIINNGSARSVVNQCEELMKVWKVMEDQGNG